MSNGRKIHLKSKWAGDWLEDTGAINKNYFGGINMQTEVRKIVFYFYLEKYEGLRG